MSASSLLMMIGLTVATAGAVADGNYGWAVLFGGFFVTIVVTEMADALQGRRR